MKKIIISCVIIFILIIIAIFSFNGRNETTEDKLTKVKVAEPTLT